MTDKMDAFIRSQETTSKDISLSMKALSEKQTNPEITKTWLAFFGGLIIVGGGIVQAIVSNIDKIQKLFGG